MEPKTEHVLYSPVNGKSVTPEETGAQVKRTYLYISVAILNLLFLLCGAAFAWSSPILMKLQLPDSDASTIVSAMPLGMMLGPFVSGALLDRLGRKATVGLNMGIMTCAYAILASVSSVSFLSLGRLMAGVTIGITFAAVPLYIAEISEDSVRGFLNTLNQVSISAGSLLMYALGPFISYAAIHYILLGICAAFFLLFPLLSDSPYSLVLKNKDVEAKRTLVKLRSNLPESIIEKELQIVQKTITESRKESKSMKELVRSRGNRLALTICLVLITSQQLCGVSVVFMYMERIFEMTGTNISSSTCSIVIGVILVASAFISPVAVNYFGYKNPMLFSIVGVTLGVGNLGAYFALIFYEVDVSSLNWLPLFSVVVFTISFNTGFSNIPWALAGEMFPNNVKSKAATLTAATSGFSSFLAVKLFPYLRLLMGMHVLFGACALFGLLTTLFIWFVVLDTSGMSFMEIQKMLNGHKSIDMSQDQPLKSDIADVEL